MQEFIEQVKRIAQNATEEMHTALPGSITAYDPATGLATVQPRAKFKKPDGTTMDFPVISGVPVHFPHSEKLAIAFPIKAGDSCMVIFSESSLDYWQYEKETDTTLKFDLSNAMCIPGLSAKENPAMKDAIDNDAVVIKAEDTEMFIRSDGVFIKGDLTVDGNMTTGTMPPKEES